MQQPPSPPGTGAYVRLIVIAAIVGIPAAFAAAAVLGLVHYTEHWLWHDLPRAIGYSSPPWFLVIGLPTAGAAIVAVVRRFLPGDGGHPPLEGLSLAPVAVSLVPCIVLAAVGTLGFGAVLGPEMPVIAIGSAAGMAVNHFARLRGRESKVVSSAGSFSALSALFDGPLVAAIMLTESGAGLGANLLTMLLPGFVAAAVGYLIFTGFGHWGGLNAPGLTVPHLPAYTGVHPGDLLAAIVVGILAAIVVAAARRIGAAVNGLRGRLGMPLLNKAEPLPGFVYAVAARVATSANQPPRPVRVRLQDTSGRWAVVRAAPLTYGTSPITQGGCAVTLERARSEDLAPLLMRAWALSPREREVARLVIDGLANEEIAAALFISANTIRDHLKAIFGKTGVTRRRDLTAALVGQPL